MENKVEVVISGVGCKLPESSSIEELAEHLYNNREVVTLDNRKWKPGQIPGIQDHTGKMKNITQFDSTFFGINRMVARSLDPITGLLLEATYEAIIDAGLTPHDLKGTNTNVYYGSCFAEADIDWVFDFKGGYSIMGRNRSMNPNRISYWLDINGSSTAFDNNWCAGIQAMKLGAEAIQSGHTDAVIVATGNMLIHPEVTYQYKHCGFLSTDGVCRSFDEDANGFVRSDAICVYLLQRKDIAKRNYASIVGAFACLYGDKEECITEPSVERWTEFLGDCYKQSGINPHQVCYVEANSDGIKEHEEAELNALDAVFCQNRSDPLLVGSVKSNLGHSEASAVFTSIAKVIIGFQNEKILGNWNYNKPNKNIPALIDGRLKVALNGTGLPDGYYAVNGYGFNGAYGHLILKPNNKTKPIEAKQWDGLSRLVFVSTRIAEQLEPILKKIESMDYDAEYVRMLHEVYTKTISKHLGRGYTILPPTPGVETREINEYPGRKRPVWFVYSGMGSQWNGMASTLLKIKVFKEAIDICHETLKPYNVDLYHIITSKEPKLFDNILNSFVGIAAIQIGLTDVLRSLDIVPDGILGHSVGELGCAYADGCFTRQEMILAAYCRGRASIETNLIRGKMAAIGKGYKEMKVRVPEDIDVACHNSSDSCTISGPAESIDKFVSILQQEGIFAKAVNVSNIAYHSRYIKPAAPKLLKYLKEVLPTPKLRSKKWISTSVPVADWNKPEAMYCSPNYHTNNLLGSVLFEEGLAFIPDDAVIIEIAPHGLLQAILKRALPADTINIPLTTKTAKDGALFLLQAIGKMYLSGLNPQIGRLYPEVEFPVSRGTQSLHQLACESWEHSYEGNDLRKTKNKDRHSKAMSISLDKHLKGYLINEKNAYPLSYFLVMVLKQLSSSKDVDLSRMSVVFENIRIHKVVYITREEQVKINLMLHSGSGSFQIIDKDGLLMSGIVITTRTFYSSMQAISIPETRCEILTQDIVYKLLRQYGLDLNVQFRNIQQVKICDNKWIGSIKWKGDHGKFLDSINHLLSLVYGYESEKLYLPFRMVKLNISSSIMNVPIDSELEAVVDKIENTVKCGPIQIQGVNMIELERDEQHYEFQTCSFLPYYTTRQDKLMEFVESCTKLCLDNTTMINNVGSFQLGYNINNNNKYILEHIHNYLTKQYDVEVKLQEVDVNNRDVVATDLILIDSGICSLNIRNNSFVLVIGHQQQVQEKDLIEIAKDSSGDQHFTLYKKILPTCRESVNIFEFGDQSSWNNDLITMKKIVSNTCKNTYIVCRHGSVESVSVLVDNLRHNLPFTFRIFFLLDSNVPRFAIDHEFYKQEMKKDLIVNIYFNRCWGFINIIKFDRQFLKPLPQAPVEYSSFYSCMNFQTSVVGKPKQMEFSGILKINNCRMMGVGSVLESNKCKIQPDPLLVWSAPDSWSLDEAATVPLAYCVGYFCLMLKRRLKPRHKVFIQDGACIYGQALINIATHAGAQVFVAVYTESDRQFLLNNFSRLVPGNVYVDDGPNIDVFIKTATNGTGTDFTINCTGSGKTMEAAFRCLAKNGRFYSLSNTDFIENTTLNGTSIFIENCEFYGVAGDNIIRLHTETKEKLVELLQHGITNGVVQPLPKRIFDSHELQEAMEYWRNNGDRVKVVINSNCQPITEYTSNISKDYLLGNYSSFSSFLVIGEKGDMCLEAAYWLSINGIGNIVLSYTVEPLTSIAASRRKIFIKNKTEVVMFDGQTSNASKLIETANEMGPLAGVLVIRLDKNVEKNPITARQVSQCYKGKSDRLICIVDSIDDEMNVCGERNRYGLHGLAVLWETCTREQLQSLLTRINCLPFQGSFLTAKTNLHTERTINKNLERLATQLFPKDLDALSRIASTLSNKPILHHLPSRCCPASDVKDSGPIVFVPGLYDAPVESLKLLAQKLLYPTYCIQIPSGYNSIKELASCITPLLIEQIKGDIINLVGVTWGGTLAIELATQLQRANKHVSITIIDGPPELIKKSLERFSSNLQVALLSRIFDLTVNEVSVLQREHGDWDSRVQFAVDRVVENINCTPSQLTSTVKHIYNNTKAFMNYETSSETLSIPVTLIHSNVQEPEAIDKISHFFRSHATDVNPHKLEECVDLPFILHESALCRMMNPTYLDHCLNQQLQDVIEENENCQNEISNYDKEFDIEYYNKASYTMSEPC